jgi:hypothetical protein
MGIVEDAVRFNPALAVEALKPKFISVMKPFDQVRESS